MITAIIGGRGLATLADVSIERREVVRTPYGEPSSPLVFGRLGDCPLVFLARHGHGVTIPPHIINYRANLWALKSIGVENIIAVASSGGVTEGYLPGSLVIPDQLIDYTWGREHTFHDSWQESAYHAEFAEPYDADLRQILLDAGERAGISLIGRGTYAATQGPRLDTRAEIDRYERDGADLVGMTGMPEAILARELQMAYASVALVVNHAAGRGEPIAAAAIREQQIQGREKIEKLLAEALAGCCAI
jgi:5'-methylthioadenosine phosphorylase